MLGRERKLSHDEWAAWLQAPGQKLTLDEFVACEVSMLHVLAERIHSGLGLDALHENGTGGYAEQMRNLLDRFVTAVTVARAAQTRRPPTPPLTGGPTPVRLLRSGEQSPEEGA